MMCPNTSHPSWRELVNKVGVNRAYQLYFENGSEIPDPEMVTETLSGVNSGLKVLNAVTSERGLQLFNKFFKNNKDKYFNELTQLTGKYQSDLLREASSVNNLQSVEDIVNYITSEMSYTVELEVAKNQQSKSSGEYGSFELSGEYFRRVFNSSPEDYTYERSSNGGTQAISQSEYNEARNRREQLDKTENINSDFYSLMTVNGGIDYKEIDVNIPGIEVNQLPHNSFSGVNSLGWFRLDTSQTNQSTRRILEMQSDLFQSKAQKIESLSIDENANRFLGILKNNNNWISFFIQSIIQDSRLNGFSKVLFPSKETLVKIQDFSDDLSEMQGKQAQIKELENKIQSTTNPESLANLRQKLENSKKDLKYIKNSTVNQDNSVMAFYDQALPNTLKKLYGSNVESVTDEFGNSWNQVTLTEQDTNEFFFQQPISNIENVEERNEELETELKAFLDRNNISYQAVSEIRNPVTGEVVPAIGIADMINRVVQVVEGNARPDTLPEEASHILIELLGEDHPLYKSMYNEIVNYEAYQETLELYGDLSFYKGNETKLRKEAMAKVIAQKLLGNEASTVVKEDERYNRWFNKVLKFIKDRIKTLIGMTQLQSSIIKADSFSEAAKFIFDQSQDFSNSSYASEEWFLQTVDQDTIVNLINTKYKISKDSDGYVLNTDNGPQRVKNRVTDRVKKFMDRTFGGKEKTEAEELFAEITAQYGTKGHDDLENALKRAISLRQGTISPAYSPQLAPSIYEKLEKYALDFVESVPTDSIILTEVPIYSSKDDEGGTVDILIIHADGTASIYDWKFISMGKNKKIPWYKTQAINIQLPRYQSILKEEYGVKGFRETRAIPIEANYKGKILEGVKIGNVNMQDMTEEESHLLPLPTFNERTGDAGLDKLLLSLINEKDKISASKSPSSATDAEREAFEAKKWLDLERIQKAIRDIQLKHDISEYVRMGKDLTATLNSSNLADYTDEELQQLVDRKLNFYGKELIELLSTSLGKDIKEYAEELSSLSGNAQYLSGQLSAEIKRRVLERNPSLMNAQKATSWWNRNMRTLFEQSHPIVGAFGKLIQRSNESLRQEYTELESKVREATDNLRRNGINNFDFMLRTTNNGRLRVAPKYSSDFYDKLTNYRSVLRSSNASKVERAEARDFINKHMSFNQAQYNERLVKFKNKMEGLKRHGYSEPQIQDRINDYMNKYSNNDVALGNVRNSNLSIKESEEIMSKEYKNIVSNPSMKEFYDLWMDYSNKYQNYIGVNKGSNFVWNVPMNLVESIAQNGFSGIVNPRAFVEHLEAKEYGEVGQYDVETGEVVLRIPVAFSQENTKFDSITGEIIYDSKNQSRDLGSVLLGVSAMAINHKNMSDIESEVNVLTHLMGNSEVLATNKIGKLLKDPNTGEIIKTMNNAKNLDQFRAYRDYYIYGRKFEHDDHLIAGKYSSIGVYKMASNFFRSKALAFNPISIVGNLVGGHLNAVMMGASNLYFRTRDFEKAHVELARGGDKVNGLRGYFDVEEGGNYNLRGTKVSMHVLNKALTKDNLYIGQRFADWSTKHGVMLAMTKFYKVVDGRLVNGRKAPKDAPSLFDYVSAENGELDFKDISQEDLAKFRKQVLGVINKILGTGNENDIRLASRNVFMDMLLMFRSWLPATFDVRFGELRKNENLETWEMGRYRTFFNEILKPNILRTLKDLMLGFGTFGLGSETRNTTIEHAKVLYAEAKAKNPTLEITEEEFIDVHLANLRASMIELYAMIAMSMLVFLAAPDDEEKKSEMSGLRKFALNALDKFNTELLTYISPTEFDRMIKNPIPITRLYSDVKGLMSTITMEGVETVTGDDTLTKPNDLRKYSFRLFPVLSGIESMLQYIEDDYNKVTDGSYNPRSQ